ncbi:outer membrane protein precursor [Candidatus Blochmanniella floridana]|uniref:Outer membrane protein assembly factor BamA n=1 Tax=Blochmanniella floridana TaxID=203907 RepID=Q7VRD8_BLOFL|nr:outer membrane protein precursor [Candidatus Blochmannia floridanus]
MHSIGDIINNIIKKLIIMFLFIISNVTYGDDFIVKKIFFHGLHRMSSDAILYQLPLKVGTTISNKNVSDSIRFLFSTGYFSNVSVFNDENGIIVIKVEEYPIIHSIEFSGNKIIKTEMIQSILNSKNIKIGSTLNDYFIFEANNDIQDIYHNFGKFNVSVKINTIVLPKNRVIVKITVYEGKTANVKQIKIFGNYIFSQKKLLKQFSIYKQIKWNNIFHRNVYKKQKFFYDLESLRVFYLSNGYAKFCIDETDIKMTPDKRNVYLNIYITEGLQYILESVSIHGDVLCCVPSIKDYCQTFSTELYDINKINKIEHDIRLLLGRYGYIKPAMSIEYDFNDHKKVVKLHIYIDVGHRFYVREVQFEGNNFTQDFVIRREIKQLEQSLLNYHYVLQDQERLSRLNYFKLVNTRIENVPNKSNQVDLIYKIEELNTTGNLNLSVGLGTESGLNIQIGMNQDNVLGTGNSISVTATKNYYQTYCDMSILKKYLGTRRINTSIQIFYNNFSTNKVHLSNYSIKNYGISMDFAYPVTENNSYNIGLNYISNHLDQIEPQIAVWRYLYSVGINPELISNYQYLNNRINLYPRDLLLVLGWSFNSLNHMYFPNFGSFINITNKLTLPGSYNSYYKIILDSNHYLPLNKSLDWILFSSIYAGYAGSLYNHKESPFYDNFYIGGIRTIRGFRLNSIGPKAAYYHCNKSDISYSTCSVKNSQDTVGGNSVTFIKNELIIPVSYMLNTQYSDTTRVSLFIDAGTVWDTYWINTVATRAAGILDYGIFGHIRISTGVALKWISPVGPVIFSYSKPIKKYQGDIEEPFQFTVGKIW